MEWKTLPGKESSPGTSGTLGSDSGPVAETTTSADSEPLLVSISHRSRYNSTHSPNVNGPACCASAERGALINNRNGVQR